MSHPEGRCPARMKGSVRQILAVALKRRAHATTRRGHVGKRVDGIRRADPASSSDRMTNIGPHARAVLRLAYYARASMLHRATAQLLRIARLALFVEKCANVLRQFGTQKLDASGFRIRAENLIRGRNLRWFGIHDLSPLRTDYLPRSPFRTSI